MPIYEYSCPDCGNQQENLIRDVRSVPVCENCGGRSLKRKLSLFAVSSVPSGGGDAHECACASGGCHGNPGRPAAGGCGHGGVCGCGS